MKSSQMVHVSTTRGRHCSVLLWPSLFTLSESINSWIYLYKTQNNRLFKRRDTHTYTVVVTMDFTQIGLLKYCWVWFEEYYHHIICFNMNEIMWLFLNLFFYFYVFFVLNDIKCRVSFLKRKGLFKSTVYKIFIEKAIRRGRVFWGWEHASVAIWVFLVYRHLCMHTHLTTKLNPAHVPTVLRTVFALFRSDIQSLDLKLQKKLPYSPPFFPAV